MKCRPRGEVPPEGRFPDASGEAILLIPNSVLSVIANEAIH
jgi:hypothetical protein